MCIRDRAEPALGPGRPERAPLGPHGRARPDRLERADPPRPQPRRQLDERGPDPGRGVDDPAGGATFAARDGDGDLQPDPPGVVRARIRLDRPAPRDDLRAVRGPGRGRRAVHRGDDRLYWPALRAAGRAPCRRVTARGSHGADPRAGPRVRRGAWRPRDQQTDHPPGRWGGDGGGRRCPGSGAGDDGRTRTRPARGRRPAPWYWGRVRRPGPAPVRSRRPTASGGSRAAGIRWPDRIARPRGSPPWRPGRGRYLGHTGPRRYRAVGRRRLRGDISLRPDGPPRIDARRRPRPRLWRPRVDRQHGESHAYPGRRSTRRPDLRAARPRRGRRGGRPDRDLVGPRLRSCASDPPLEGMTCSRCRSAQYSLFSTMSPIRTRGVSPRASWHPQLPRIRLIYD